MPAKTSIELPASYTLEDLKGLLREAESALANSSDSANEKFHALRDRLRHALEHGRTRARDFTVAARRQAIHADELVHENPYAAAGIAAAVGVLIGYLLSASCAERRRSFF
jgi:ElaB protein